MVGYQHISTTTEDGNERKTYKINSPFVHGTSGTTVIITPSWTDLIISGDTSPPLHYCVLVSSTSIEIDSRRRVYGPPMVLLVARPTLKGPPMSSNSMYLVMHTHMHTHTHTQSRHASQTTCSSASVKPTADWPKQQRSTINYTKVAQTTAQYATGHPRQEYA